MLDVCVRGMKSKDLRFIRLREPLDEVNGLYVERFLVEVGAAQPLPRVADELTLFPPTLEGAWGYNLTSGIIGVTPIVLRVATTRARFLFDKDRTLATHKFDQGRRNCIRQAPYRGCEVCVMLHSLELLSCKHLPQQLRLIEVDAAI